MAGEHPPVPGAIKISSVDMSIKRHSARTKARKAALDILFEADLRGGDSWSRLARRLAEPTLGVRELTRELVLGVCDNAAQIDARIGAAGSSDWPVQRMPLVDRNLARIAVYELDHTPIDTRAAISEALELADELSTDESVAFLNGLLGQVARTRSGRSIGSLGVVDE